MVAEKWEVRTGEESETVAGSMKETELSRPCDDELDDVDDVDDVEEGTEVLDEVVEDEEEREDGEGV